MIRFLSCLLPFLGLFVWAGCDSADPIDPMLPPVGASDALLTHDGVERAYFLYVPENYTGNDPLPLIINFHGFGSNGFEQMFYGNFRAMADTAQFIVVQPNGTLFNGQGHWNVGGFTSGSTVDDIGFTMALISELERVYNIDPKRIYATGMSNGGYMSFLLACQASETFAAIASVTGSMTPETFIACNPKRSVPVIQIHGTNDATVPYEGDTWTKPVTEAVGYWVNANNCNSEAEVASLPDTDTTDGSTVDTYTYNGCTDGAVVKHYRVNDGGHTWPGSVIKLAGSTNNDMNASADIWRFFAGYTLDGRVN